MAHLTKEEINAQCHTHIPGFEGRMEEIVGTGNGVDVIVDPVTEEELWDFGPCGFCEMGHYIGPKGSGFGVCDYCGAV